MADILPYSIETFARTLWGEGRSTGAPGMTHIASVIVNRADNPRWWGDDVVHVCLAPAQFSCWNVGDPNYQPMLAVTEGDPEFETAILIATRAMKRQLPDMTDGADSYYATWASPPSWAARATKTLDDGFHIFMRVELPAPNGGPEAPTVSINAPQQRQSDPELGDDDEAST